MKHRRKNMTNQQRWAQVAETNEVVANKWYVDFLHASWYQSVLFCFAKDDAARQNFKNILKIKRFTLPVMLGNWIRPTFAISRVHLSLKQTVLQATTVVASNIVSTVSSASQSNRRIRVRWLCASSKPTVNGWPGHQSSPAQLENVADNTVKSNGINALTITHVKKCQISTIFLNIVYTVVRFISRNRDDLFNKFRRSIFHLIKNFEKILGSHWVWIFLVTSHEMSHDVSYG